MDGRPADLGGQAGEQEQVREQRQLVVEPRRGGVDARRTRARSVRRRDAGRPAARGPRAVRRPSPSDVRTRYFQAASSARGLPENATSSADAAVVASISSQAAPEVRRERHGQQRSPEHEQRGVVVRARSPPAEQAASEQSRDRRARRPGWQRRRVRSRRRGRHRPRRRTSQSPSSGRSLATSAQPLVIRASTTVRRALPSATRSPARWLGSAATAPAGEQRQHRDRGRAAARG